MPKVALLKEPMVDKGVFEQGVGLVPVLAKILHKAQPYALALAFPKAAVSAAYKREGKKLTDIFRPDMFWEEHFNNFLSKFVQHD